MRTLCVLKTSTSLGCLSDHSQHSLRLSPSHRPCARVFTPSLSELLFHSGFYLVSHANYCNQTQVFLILHLTHYLPLSPESFSRCRLRWTTPPSPHTPTARLRPGSPPACSPPPPFLERKSATTICVPGLWITLNLKGCNARYQRVIRALVSFMRWSHCKGAWSEQRVNSHPRR